MLPSGTATKTGAGIAASGPFVGILVTMFTPVLTNVIAEHHIAPLMCDAVASNCVTAEALSATVIAGAVSLIGGWIAKWGRDRAEARHEAELAAAQKSAGGQQ